MTFSTGKKVLVVLELGEVLAHVGRGPGVIASEAGNVVKIAVVGVHSDERVVRCATSESTSTRVKRTLHLGARGRAKSSVLAAIGRLIGRLEVAGLPGLIGVVLDVEVPGQVGIFR